MVKVYIIPHTHWDREWYLTFGEYRSYLVRVLDDVIKAVHEGYVNFFLLDGQISIVKDYLSIRPKNSVLIKKLVSQGKLGVGPWYTQPDEFLVSGESLVRNLLYGLRECEKLGGCVKIGYLPDIFGHTPQLPQILNGFGIDTFLFSRGFDASIGCDFIWVSPDGSKVYARFLPDGYCHGAMLGYRREIGDVDLAVGPYNIMFPYFPMYEFGYKIDLDLAVKQVEEIVKRYSKCSNLESVLVLNGCDHLPIQSGLKTILERLREKFNVVVGGLEEFFEELKEKRNSLNEYMGELRSPKHRPILTEVLSSRVYLKQQNFVAEKLLTAYLEPLSVLVNYLGLGEYNLELIEELWNLLLLNHAHDSICGTSIDEVHIENEARFNHIIRVANAEIIQLLERIGRNTVKGRKKVIIFNPNPWESTTKAEILYPKGNKLESGDNCICFENGECSRILPIEEIDLMGKVFIKGIFIAKGLKGIGYKVAHLNKCKKTKNTWLNGREVDLGDYRVMILEEQGGALKIIDKERGETIGIFNFIVNDGDKGDEYNYDEIDNYPVTTTENSKAEIREITVTEDLARITLTTKLLIPKNAKAVDSRKNYIEQEIKIEYIFFREQPRLDVKIEINNEAEDHRMRVKNKLNIETEEVYSELHFIEWGRKIPEREPEREETEIEVKPRVHPFHDYLYLKDHDRVLMLAAKGIYEYNALKQKNGIDIYLTLFRSIGYLSRNDLKSRKGHAGPPIQTLGAQCKRKMIFEYSIIITKDKWTAVKTAKEFTQPPVAVFVNESSGDLPNYYSILEIEGDNYSVTALKKCEDRECVVTRICNLLPKENKIKPISVWEKMKKATLKEKIEKEITDKDFIVLNPHEIYTLIFQ